MKPDFELSLWQKKQAAILYHYASADFLFEMQGRINSLVARVDTLRGPGCYATRATQARQALEKFRQHTARAISERKFEVYLNSGTDENFGDLHVLSDLFVSAAEKAEFLELADSCEDQAFDLDMTIGQDPEVRWMDVVFAFSLEGKPNLIGKIPKLKVHTNIEGVTGRTPPKTGVYVPQDDPHGSLQFAWTGGPSGKLLPCSTFNEIGLDALKSIGRCDLWIDKQRTYDFARSRKYKSLFEDALADDWGDPINAAHQAVSTSAFTVRSCKWYFVELIPGEFEEHVDAGNR